MSVKATLDEGRLPNHRSLHYQSGLQHTTYCPQKVSTDKEAHTRSHEVRHRDPERDKDTRHIAAAAEYP